LSLEISWITGSIQAYLWKFPEKKEYEHERTQRAIHTDAWLRTYLQCDEKEVISNDGHYHHRDKCLSKYHQSITKDHLSYIQIQFKTFWVPYVNFHFLTLFDYDL
jgi:hypothetical protein